MATSSQNQILQVELHVQPKSHTAMLNVLIECPAIRTSRLKPRPQDRKTASQTQLAASLTQKLACRSGTSNVELFRQPLPD